MCGSRRLELPLNADMGGASVAVRAEKRANKNVKIRLLFSETETAKQNQKFPFHFFFRFAVKWWGEETREKCKEIFWSLHTRVRERVRGAHHWSSGFNSKYIRTSFNTHRHKKTARKGGFFMAEREGFEPSVAFIPRLLSKQVH